MRSTVGICTSGTRICSTARVSLNFYLKRNKTTTSKQVLFHIWPSPVTAKKKTPLSNALTLFLPIKRLCQGSLRFAHSLGLSVLVRTAFRTVPLLSIAPRVSRAALSVGSAYCHRVHNWAYARIRLLWSFHLHVSNQCAFPPQTPLEEHVLAAWAIRS